MGRRFFSKLMQEPMVHFLLAGMLIFALYYAVKQTDEQKNSIVITDAHIEKMVLNFSREWNRAPTEQELKSLLDRFIELEVSYREALAMNLDKDDEIIKRRLEQKFKFVTEDMAGLYAPTESELVNYYQQHKLSYVEPEVYCFEQIFFDAEKYKNTREQAVQTLNNIKLKNLHFDQAVMLGDRFPFDVQFNRLTPADIAKSLGTAFTDSLQHSKKTEWVGPLASSYGYHILYITSYIPSTQKPYNDVAQTVRRDFIFDLQKKYNDQLLRNFRKSYTVEVIASKAINNPALVKKLVSLNNGK